MDEKQKLTGAAKAGYALGAVGKDMVYMLSASYILYYYQDILGVEAWIMGIILMVARVFDAFNDPIMGVLVAKTKTRWGKFRPWLLIGTVTNAVILYLMFACPPEMTGSGLVAYAAVFYILWGVTYTMMDIPYWSMIPAFTKGGKEREGLTTLARSCAGVGSALVSIFAIKVVQSIGKAVGGESATARQVEIFGFKYLALVIAVLFIVFIIVTCITVKEQATVDMKTASIGEMFRALIQNDQAMAVVVTIVCINTALYITSNLVLYFFKYDLGGVAWYDNYTLFNTVGGGVQILSMMLLYPIMRKFFDNIKIFYIGAAMSIIGYGILLVLATTGQTNIAPFLVPGVLIMATAGMNNVIVTVFLANTVDYGEIKNNRRDESVIFSMQTFVVKLSSGIAALIASIALSVFRLSNAATTEAEQTMDLSLNVADSAKMGLRMVMTLIPIVVLVFAIFWFKKKYILTDEKIEDITKQIADKKKGTEA
ncbi:MAG: glycoside-pentoside-hexuronide (GPH):cation symporter [Lachnospiraceae bacterium]|nr:glycoside-pentoside-hexuronide (GPH):cation symporter [Lachnospiraceae bacterium]